MEFGLSGGARMGIRIYSQHISTAEAPHYHDDEYRRIVRGVGNVYKRVLRPDTTVEQRYVPRSTYYMSHSYLEMLNNAEIVRGIIQAEKEGFDVALVCCGNDAGVFQAREAVNIPVVGIAEAAMHLACQLGSKFALIGVDAKSGVLVERNLKLYGLESRAIARKPFRVPDDPNWMSYLMQRAVWHESMDFVREKIIPAFEKIAKECIDDGAEVICTACGMFGCLSLAGYSKVTGTAVPVVECVSVGVKTAEMLGDLRKTLGISTSKQLTYQSLLTPQMRDALAAPFYPEKQAGV
jgi:allantoin racemase